MAKERAAEKSAELKEPKVKKLSAEDKVIKTSKNKEKKEKKEKKSKKHAKIEEELASKPEVEDQTKPKNADAKQEAVSPSKEPEVISIQSIRELLPVELSLPLRRFLTDFQAAPDYMSLDESEPEPVSQKPSKKASKKEARQKTSDSPKAAGTESKSKKTSDSPKPKKTSDEKEPKSKKSKDKKKSEDKVEASKDGKKAGKEADKKDDKKDAKKAEKKAPVSSAVEVESTKDEEKNDSSSDSDSDSDSEEGGAKVEDTKTKSTNTTGPNRHARRRLILIDRQKIKIQKRLGVEEGSTEPNEEVDKALKEWTENFDELNAQSVKKKAVRAKQALKKRNDNHKRTTKGLTTKQLDKIHKRRNAKRDAKFAAPAA